MRKYTVLLTLVCFTISCSGVQYSKSFNRWTRSSNKYSYETLDARILWHATYLSADFRQEAKLRIDDWMQVSSLDYIPDVNYLENPLEGHFIVSIYTPRDYPNLTVDGSNFWEFKLELSDGTTISPSSIQTVTITEREKRLFPYSNRWSQFYWVKFPVSGLQPPFSLALRSAGGTSILKWKVEGE